MLLAAFGGGELAAEQAGQSLGHLVQKGSTSFAVSHSYFGDGRGALAATEHGGVETPSPLRFSSSIGRSFLPQHPAVSSGRYPIGVGDLPQALTVLMVAADPGFVELKRAPADVPALELGSSLDDAVSEMQATFVARAVEPLSAVPGKLTAASAAGSRMNCGE
jgi:hypothetical protein